MDQQYLNKKRNDYFQHKQRKIPLSKKEYLVSYMCYFFVLLAQKSVQAAQGEIGAVQQLDMDMTEERKWEEKTVKVAEDHDRRSFG